MYRIGVDVGGTNTDAAILDGSRLDEDGRGVLATCKTPTTADVTNGVKHAIRKVVEQSGINPTEVFNVAIGTTHFVNAVVENDASNLQRVAVIRLCGPYTRRLPPFSDYPYALRDIVEGPVFYLDGGLEIDGREIMPLNEEQILETAKEIHEIGISAVAIVGVFSALDHHGRQEERCKSLIQQNFPRLSVVCSHKIGGPGLLVRENATILNAAILSFARMTVKGFRQAVLDLNLNCPLYLTQNDGTLIEATAAAELPVKTFASGPTNSLMGAAFLLGLDRERASTNRQLLVVDVGGTTTDVCSIMPSGFPRKAPNFVEVGGVRTAFSMPEVYSVGLGGGSYVRELEDGQVTVGPDSVGYQLTSQSRVFGGEILTATDITVAAGSATIGKSDLVDGLSAQLARKARAQIQKIANAAIEKMKISPSPITAILVGGGSVILGDNLPGVVECLRPQHHDSANAVGAAIAKVAGDVDTVVVLEGQDEDQVLEQVKMDAISAAIANGADEEKVEVVEVSKIPQQYVSNKTSRFIIKAVGPLKPLDIHQAVSIKSSIDSNLGRDQNGHATSYKKLGMNKLGSMATPTAGVDLANYRPHIKNGVWVISPIDVVLIASGCGILGTGGGGSSYDMSLYVLDLLRNGGQGKIRVIAPKSLSFDGLTVNGSGYGAPSVSNERVSSGNDVFDAILAVNDMMGIKDFEGIIADEIGGGNGIVTFPTSAHFDRPVVDADYMGRAYPTVAHCTATVYGQPSMPCAIADCKGNIGAVMKAETTQILEGLLRRMCEELGNAVACAGRPLPGHIVQKYAIPNTVSQAWYLGRAVHIARQTKVDFIEAIGDVMPVKLLYTGKITDVTRDVSKGYTVGRCVLEPTYDEESHSTASASQRRRMIIPFQNEYLAAYLVNQTVELSEREVMCVVPDLISILGADGEALGSADLRYGLHVKVIGMPAHPLWTATPEAMRIGGPEFFGLDMNWKPISEYRLPRSVFDEFESD